MPQVRSAIREITASYDAKALYSSEREQIARETFELVQKMTGGRGVIVESVLLRKIGLPAIVANAIQEKLKREQESEQMKFVLAKEQQEAERKRIEAQGIADFQKIVAAGHHAAAARVEGHRGDREAGDEPEHEGRRRRQSEERPADHPRGRRGEVSESAKIPMPAAVLAGRRLAPDGPAQGSAAVRRRDAARVPDGAPRGALRGGARRREGAARLPGRAGPRRPRRHRGARRRSTASCGRSRRPPTAIFVLGVDLPAIPRGAPRRDRRALARGGRGGRGAARRRPTAAARGRLAAVGPARSLDAGSPRGELSLQGLAEEVGAEVLEEKDWRALDPSGTAFANLNTLEQYAALRERA